MNTLLLSIIVGLVIGIIDIIPMIIQKLPRHSTISAFLFYFFITIVIFHTDIPYLSWWLEGVLISIAMMSPLLILVGATDKKPLPIITINSMVLGALISVAKYYLI